MINKQSNAQEVIERLSSAYGVSTQRALAEALTVPSNNVSAWVQRNSVPGSAIIKCALDTNADLNWLVTGKLEKANQTELKTNLSGKLLYEEIMANGGRPVLRRILDAYGFTMQKQLCELLEISSGTVSTWIRRSYFPGDVVVTCALDTGVSLKWLATGKGMHEVKNFKDTHGQTIPHKILDTGMLKDVGTWLADISFLQKVLSEPAFITSSTGAWVVDLNIKGISNGCWLLGIDEKFDIYDVALLPGHKINVIGQESNFICNVNEISVAGKVVLTMSFHS